MDPRTTTSTSSPDDGCLRQVLDNLIGFAGVLAPDGTVLEVNNAALEAGGISEKEVIGQKCWDCCWFSFSPEGQRLLRDAVQRAASGELVRYDAMVRMGGDTRSWIEMQLAPMRDSAGRITHLLTSAVDISDHKRAVELLRESAEHLRFALRGAKAGAWDWDIRAGTMVWSEENYRLHGVDPEKRPMHYADWEACVHHDDRERAHHAVQEALSGRTAEFRCEFRVAPPTGEVRWLVGLGRVDRAADGTPVRMSGINLDITDRKRTEMLLAKRTALLEAFTATAPVGLAFVDDTCRYVRVNDMLAEINGLPARDHIGRTVSEVVPDLWPQVEPLFRQALAGTATVNVEVSDGVAGAGPHGDWLVSYYPVRFDAGIMGVGIVVVDITAQKRTEALLREADRRKDDFLATLAHELRNPLAPIRNAVSILNLQAPRDSTSQAARNIIERQLQQMVRLVDDLLDVSRITRGKLELRRECVSLKTVLDQAIEAAIQDIERCGHQLSVSWPGQPVCLDADAARLAQVFSNLLDNACKYTQRGGHIRVTIERKNAEVEVSVRDNGIGISPTHLPHVFEMFSQEGTPLDRTHGGLGLGLSLTRSLVEMHGGTIQAKSGGAGMGSEFVVRLPTSTQEVPAGAPTRISIHERKALAADRILVADDSRDSTQSLATLLRMNGNNVETAYDGLEALQKAQEYRPDVILLDIGMPKMNGYEVCRAIRAQPWGGHIVIVAITGWGHEQDRQKSKEAGFDGHLVKPLDYTALVDLLSSLPARTSAGGAK